MYFWSFFFPDNLSYKNETALKLNLIFNQNSLRIFIAEFLVSIFFSEGLSQTLICLHRENICKSYYNNSWLHFNLYRFEKDAFYCSMIYIFNVFIWVKIVSNHKAGLWNLEIRKLYPQKITMIIVCASTGASCPLCCLWHIHK